jgi:hypothetical protein
MIRAKTAPYTKERYEDPLKYFTSVFLSFLQEVCKNNEVGNYKYSDDLDKTEIIIADQANMLREELPRIISARGPVNVMPLSVDDFIEEEDGTSIVKSSHFIQTSLSFNCLAKLGLEAQKIAWLVATVINDYHRLLNTFGIHKILRNSISISPETPATAVTSPETKYECSLIIVTVPFIFRHTFIKTPVNAPAAYDIKLKMNSSLGILETDIKPDHIGVPPKPKP